MIIEKLKKNKREERKGKIQLIDCTSEKFYKKLRKSVGNKRNEISPQNRKAITKLYTDFKENEYCKIYDNEEFIYREYTVMQPLQRSYAITEERIDNMLSKGCLSSLYDEAKVYEYENSTEKLSDKDQKKLDAFITNKPIYDSIVNTLKENVSDKVYLKISEFEPVIAKVLNGQDKKIISKITDDSYKA